MRLSRTLVSPPVLALIAANLLPLVCALFFGWSAKVLLLLYWAENLIIGFYNVLKMLFAREMGQINPSNKPGAIVLFCFHYGLFCTVHGIFIVVLSSFADGAVPACLTRSSWGRLSEAKP
jgi:hypothetical protein